MTDFIIPPDPADYNQPMGHVEDTEHVRELEARYKQDLVGYGAKWHKVGDVYRVQIWTSGRWIGTYPMHRDDLAIYNVR